MRTASSDFSDCYLDLETLSRYSSLSISTLRGYLREGLACYRVKGKILVKRSEFDEFMSQYRTEFDAIADKVVARLESNTQAEGHGRESVDEIG